MYKPPEKPKMLLSNALRANIPESLIKVELEISDVSHLACVHWI